MNKYNLKREDPAPKVTSKFNDSENLRILLDVRRILGVYKSDSNQRKRMRVCHRGLSEEDALREKWFSFRDRFGDASTIVSRQKSCHEKPEGKSTNETRPSAFSRPRKIDRIGQIVSALD